MGQSKQELAEHLEPRQPGTSRTLGQDTQLNPFQRLFDIRDQIARIL